jgi:hypothetical protein
MTPLQQQRLLERHAKKLQLAAERRNKPLDKLKELYAAGKITQAQFDELAKRDSDVTIDLMIFGRGSGVKLAERYLSGKIKEDDFESLKNELLGPPEAEKDSIIEGYKAAAKDVSDYIEKARSQKSTDFCNYCGKKKGFFSPLHAMYDFRLCGTCKKQFSSLQRYDGFNGQYYASASAIIEPDIKNSLELNIQPQYVLEYR